MSDFERENAVVHVATRARMEDVREKEKMTLESQTFNPSILQ